MQSTLYISVVLFISCVVCAGSATADDELLKVAAAYKNIQPPFAIRATVARRTSRGDRVQEVQREYRIGESNGVLRMDAGMAGQTPLVTIVNKGSQITLHLAEPNAYADLDIQAEDARPVHDAIRRAYQSIFGRLASLDSAGATVVSQREARIRAGGGARVAGRQIKVKSGPGTQPRWEGELWVDAASFLVWRARITTHADGVTTEEVVEWKEISVGDQVDPYTFSWRPPAGSKKLLRIPEVLP